MQLVRWMAVAVLQSVIPAIASAQSLRCEGSLVSPGDSKLGLLRACGQPAASDQFCTWIKPNPAPYAPGYGLIRPADPICVPVEELLYERGPGNMPAFVRIREGRIVSIRFGNSRWNSP